MENNADSALASLQGRVYCNVHPKAAMDGKVETSTLHIGHEGVGEHYVSFSCRENGCTQQYSVDTGYIPRELKRHCAQHETFGFLDERGACLCPLDLKPINPD
jgi:hypothetical protein